MPFANVNGARLFYRLDGLDDRPAILFCHSLGVDHSQWDYQAAALLPHFRILRYDLRGHGASDSTPGEYTLELLGKDALAVADAAGLRTFSFCGLSIGGMVGQWLGANTPDRITHLILANTTSRQANPQIMQDRRDAVLKSGMNSVVDGVLQRFFLPKTLAANLPEVASVRQRIVTTDPVGYAGCCSVVRDLDTTSLLEKIRASTLVISGDYDQSTPKASGDALAAAISGAKNMSLPTAHLSNVERPRSFTVALLKFLLPPPKDLYAAGMERRRAALGDEHVDRAIAGINDFNAEMQKLIAQYPWGTIWTRPQFDQRTRRLLVLSMMVAMGRWEEFRLHLRTGLRHELEPCDVEDILLQAAVYAGIPIANTGFHIAAEELAQLEKEASS